MLTLERRHLTTVDNILNKYPYQFYVFGSRTKGTAKKYSDLDLCCKDEISWIDLAHLNEDFEESDLPFRVDLVSWTRIDDNFKRLIEKDLFLLKK